MATELVYENKRWAIYKDKNIVYIKQAGFMGHTGYAFWNKGDEFPKSHDFYNAKFATNYPLFRVPVTIINRARKVLNSL